MTPFKKFQRLANQIRDKHKICCGVDARHFAYESGGSDLSYFLYISEPPEHFSFSTAKEAISEMKNILNPPIDDGVSLE